MSVMPIPRSKIREFGQELDYRGEALERFHHIIRMMDDHYLGIISKKG